MKPSTETLIDRLPSLRRRLRVRATNPKVNGRRPDQNACAVGLVRSCLAGSSFGFNCLALESAKLV